jgi:phage terminase small subunit
MSLTPKQEKFAQCVADGMAQAEAYRVAFNVKPETKAETSQANASRLMANSKISARVNELRFKLTEKGLWTREMSVKALIETIQEGNGSVRVAAVKELNAMHGFNAPKKLDLISTDGSMTPKEISNEVLAALTRKHSK